MASDGAQRAADWLGSFRTSALAWWIPKAAIAAGLLAEAPARTAIWTLALAWMGTACILNARRCGRTHCRYTGPFYLAMIVPVGVIGFGIVSAGLLGWLVVGALALSGGMIIWLATERAWGRFS